MAEVELQPITASAIAEKGVLSCAWAALGDDANFTCYLVARILPFPSDAMGRFS